MILVSRITIEGFRGFAKERTLSFDTPIVLLFGENGTGKSSALNAIEWCLYGRECIGASTGIRERVGWQVENRFASTDGVRVRLQGKVDGIQLDVTRALNPGRTGRSRETLELRLDGDSLADSDALLRLSQVVRCSFRDFLTTVYQHQEVIRAMLVQEARERNDAIDRLLGLTDYRNILTGIDAARIAREFRDRSSERDSIAHDIGFAVRQRERDLEGLQARAEQAGVRDSDATPTGALGLAERLCSGVADFYSSSGLSGLTLEQPRSIQDLASFCRSARRSLAEARGGIPAASQQQQLLARRASVMRLQQTLRDLDADSHAVRNEIKSYERQHQSIETVEQTGIELSDRQTELSNQLRALNVRAPLLREGIEVLKSVDDREHCPLCGSLVPDLVDRLQDEWDRQIRAEVGDIQAQVDGLRKQQEEVAEVLRSWRDANNQGSELEDNKATFRKSVTEILETEVGDETDIAMILTEELRTAQDALDSVEQSVGAKMQAIDVIEDEVERIEIALRLIEERDRIARISKIRESEDFLLMEDRFEELASFAADVDAVKDAIASASNAEAEGLVKESSQLIDEYFRQIADHPGVRNVSLEVIPDRRTGRNSYSFVDQDGEDLLPVLSQGDMNSLALSIFLGLSTAAASTSPFGFILLDDPSQSLGSQEKQRVAELLNSVSRRVNVLVATMDSEFASVLSQAVTSDRLTTYQFQDWSPSGGPVVQEASLA